MSRSSLHNFFKLKNMNIVYKVLLKLQVVNKFSKNYNMKVKIKTNVHFDDMLTVNEQKR